MQLLYFIAAPTGSVYVHVTWLTILIAINLSVSLLTSQTHFKMSNKLGGLRQRIAERYAFVGKFRCDLDL